MTADPSLSLQTALRSRLTASAALTALVPADAIHDAFRRPEGPACIVLGDGQTVLEDRYYARNIVRVYLDMHIWTRGNSLEPVKRITGAVSSALKGPAPALDVGTCVDFRLSHTRFMHDPGNEWGHGVASIEALIEVPL